MSRRKTPKALEPDDPSSINVGPEVELKETLVRDVPYEQTEAGYAALGNYWREFKHKPPDDFNLKEWAKGR